MTLYFLCSNHTDVQSSKCRAESILCVLVIILFLLNFILEFKKILKEVHIHSEWRICFPLCSELKVWIVEYYLTWQKSIISFITLLTALRYIRTMHLKRKASNHFVILLGWYSSYLPLSRLIPTRCSWLSLCRQHATWK